jgi:hypothetical protein
MREHQATLLPHAVPRHPIFAAKMAANLPIGAVQTRHPTCIAAQREMC